jgi:hypothetical protein
MKEGHKVNNTKYSIIFYREFLNISFASGHRKAV